MCSWYFNLNPNRRVCYLVIESLELHSSLFFSVVQLAFSILIWCCSFARHFSNSTHPAHDLPQ